MKSLRNALDTVRQKYNGVSESVFQGALDYVVSGTIVTGNGCHMFPVTEGYPAGMTVRDHCCSCTMSEEWVACAHIIAVDMLMLCDRHDELQQEVSRSIEPAKAIQESVAQKKEPHSMTVTAIDTDGFGWLICVRSVSVNELFEDAREVKERITKYGWHGTNKSMSPLPQKETETKETETEITTPVMQTKEEIIEPKIVQPEEKIKEQETEKRDALTFMAESLVATVHEGKAYFKCRGGRFSKFGVTIWPEVLEAAGLKNLDPMKIYDMHGYTAEYVVKEDGKSDKIIRLTKTGA